MYTDDVTKKITGEFNVCRRNVILSAVGVFPEYRTQALFLFKGDRKIAMFYRHICGEVVLHTFDTVLCVDTFNKAISPLINNFDALLPLYLLDNP